jgi:hypothetical protein
MQPEIHAAPRRTRNAFTECEEGCPGCARHQDRVTRTRPIRRLPETDPYTNDPDDAMAREEAAEQERVRDAAARPSAIHQLSLDAIAALALYEASALTPGRPAGELGDARRSLIAAIEQLARQAQEKGVLMEQLGWRMHERAQLERALGCLVPQGRMGEFVRARIHRAEVRHGG